MLCLISFSTQFCKTDRQRKKRAVLLPRIMAAVAARPQSLALPRKAAHLQNMVQD